MKNILVVDDDKEIQKALSIACRNEDFTIISAFSIDEANQLLKTDFFDLIILDILLPDGNGFDFLQQIRDREIVTPVICLSSKDDETYKVAGLGIGADDYITKPFSLSLLKSKIKALIRRNTFYARDNSVLPCGKFSYDPRLMAISLEGNRIDFTAKEFQIMKLFLENPQQVFTKEQIYCHVWNNNVVDDNTITVYIKRIREKIEVDSSNPKYLLTVWGLGYKFIQDGQKSK